VLLSAVGQPDAALFATSPAQDKSGNNCVWIRAQRIAGEKDWGGCEREGAGMWHAVAQPHTKRVAVGHPRPV